MAAVEMVALGVLVLPAPSKDTTIIKKRVEIIGLVHEDLRDNYPRYSIQPWTGGAFAHRSRPNWHSAMGFVPYHESRPGGFGPVRLHLAGCYTPMSFQEACRLIVDDFKANNP